MVVIVYKETLEAKLRRDYNIPPSVQTKDLYSFIGKRMAERTIERVKMRL